MSHNNFQAFFSAGDDKDEVAGKLFGVIGMLHTDNPTSVWRAGFNRQTQTLELWEIFVLDDVREYTIPDDAIHNITEKRNVIHVTPKRVPDIPEDIPHIKSPYELPVYTTPHTYRSVYDTFSSLAYTVFNNISSSQEVYETIVEEITNAYTLVTSYEL